MKKQEYDKMLDLPVEEYCNKVLELFPQNTGYAYKIDTPFAECELDDIVYVPERSFKEFPNPSAGDDLSFIEFDTYTKQDFIEMCDECKELAEYVFESLEWQHPETYIEELCMNYTDIVIDYQKDRIHANPVNETLWNMLGELEQCEVIKECNAR